MKDSIDMNEIYCAEIDTNTPSKFIESLNLMDAVKLLDTLKAILFNASDRDQSKIDFFKNELSTGRYEVHPQQIAYQLLEDLPLPIEAEIA